MDEIIRVLGEALAALESVEPLLDQETNEDAAELQRAYSAAVANLGRTRSAAATLRDGRAGVVAVESPPRPRHPDDDGD